MIIRHTQQDIQTYFDTPALNQSSIKIIISSGMESFLDQQNKLVRLNDLYYEEKEHFIIGSAVDCYLTQGEESFNNCYHFSNLLKKPGEKVMSIIKMVYDNAIANGIIPTPFLDQDWNKEIWEACNANLFFMNRAKPDWHDDGRLATVYKDGLAQLYWEDLLKAGRKQILSDPQKLLIDSIIQSLLTHKHTSHIFQDGEDIDIVYQLPMYWTLRDIPCKGLIDILLVNHDMRAIIPGDIKTLGDYTSTFPVHARKRRYDLQAAFYENGLRHFIPQLCTLLGKDVSNYEIGAFTFIAESTIKPGVPLLFPISEEIIKVGQEGDGDRLLGFKQGVLEYKKWADVDFVAEEVYRATNGVLWIGEDFKVV